MHYKHITLNWTLEGLSPKKVISDLEAEGFSPLYSKIVPMFCEFLCKKNPFNDYKKIVAVTPKIKEKKLRMEASFILLMKTFIM